MGEKKTGKRLAKEDAGSRSGRRWIVAAAVLAAVLLAGYLGLCAWVGACGTTLPGITAGGVSLGGLSQSEVDLRLEEELVRSPRDFSAWFLAAAPRVMEEIRRRRG